MDKLNVAVCEDCDLDALHIKEMLEQAPFNTDVTMFSRTDDFLSTFAPGLYDLVLMDIYLVDGDKEYAAGVSAVEVLRRVDPTVPVAFTTTSLDHALDGYRLNVARYLIKPVNRGPVEEVLQIALDAKHNRPGITIRSERKDITVSPDQLLYAEQDGHYYTVHMFDGRSYRVRGKLNDLEEQLGSDKFFRCHQSYLVNLAFVQGVDSDDMSVILYGGARAFIRRNWLTRTRTAWEDWLFEMTRKRDGLQ